MKRISEITNGKYNYATDTPSFLKIAESFGDNRVETPLIAYQRGKGISKVLKKIAVPMLSEEEMNKGDDTQQDQIARLRGTKAYQKCAICFSDKDPMTKGAFNISGRYCPNCGQPLHMACAGMGPRITIWKVMALFFDALDVSISYQFQHRFKLRRKCIKRSNKAPITESRSNWRAEFSSSRGYCITIGGTSVI